MTVSSDRVDTTTLREQPTITRFNKKKTTFTDEYTKAVMQIKASITQSHFMRIIGEPKSEYTKSHKLRKAAFKQYLSNRYGS